MSRDDRRDRTTSFTARLLVFHDALVVSEQRPVATAAAGPDDFGSRWNRAVACINALDELRRADYWPQTDGAPRPGAERGEDPLRFGRFEIRQEIGHGAYGVVCLAFDPVLRRLVALKIPRPEILGDEDCQNRLLFEARAAAALSHPNLVTVYEIGRVGPAWFIAMQYCSGRSLANWLRTQKLLLTPRATAELIAALADATQYIHGCGIVHRDIKPGNILLDPIAPGAPHSTQAIPGFVPKLADFGLAQLSQGNLVAGKSGVLIGTPAYMAPEQAAGQRSEIGPASDIYSLGVVLYELLTGTTPYQGRDDLDTLRRIGEGRFVLPSRLRRDVPRDLDAICLKCLEREPQRRYASADELANDLRRFLRAEPVRARRAGRALRILLWSRRQPVVAGLTAALIIGGAVSLCLVAWQWRVAVLERARAQANFAQAHRSLRHIHDLLFNAHHYDERRFDPLRRDVIDALLVFYEDLLSRQVDDPALIADVAEAHYHAGFLSLSSGEKAQAEQFFQRSLQLWERVDQDRGLGIRNQVFLMKTHHQLAMLRDFRGDVAGAMETYRKALCVASLLLARAPGDASLCDAVADLHHGFAGSLKYSAQWRDALRHLKEEQILRNRRATLDPASPSDLLKVARCEYKIAQVLANLECIDEARCACRAAGLTLEKIANPTTFPPDRMGSLAQLLHLEASLHRSLGNEGEFLALEERSRELYDRLTSAQSHNPRWSSGLAHCELALASFHETKGAFGPALAGYERACRLNEEIVQRHPKLLRYSLDLAGALSSLATLHIHERRFTDAEECLKRAARICASSSEPTLRSKRVAERVAAARRKLTAYREHELLSAAASDGAQRQQ